MIGDPLAPLYAELQRLDLLLHREILRLRATYQLSLDEFRGLYISDEQVDSLINRSLAEAGSTATIDALTQQAAALREANAARLAEDSPWRRLIREFALSSAEQDILLLALAPELDLKYETLYAYLNNDITRKWPSCHLALRLLADSPAERAGLRQWLLPQAPLFAQRLLRLIEPAAGGPSSLGSGFALTPVVAQYLLGQRYHEPSLSACLGWSTPAPASEPLLASAEQDARLIRLVERYRTTRSLPLLLFQGRPGSGRRRAAEAVCARLGMPLLSVNLDRARAMAESLPKLIDTALLQSRLEAAGLYLEGIESLFNAEGHPLAEGFLLADALMHHPQPVFCACAPGTHWQALWPQGVVCLPFAEPDHADRIELWRTTLESQRLALAETELTALAGRFQLTPGQIKAAVTAAVDTGWLAEPPPPLAEALFAAARAQSDHSLGRLAVKVKLIHTWQDLILPSVTLARVQEIANAIRHRHVVYSEWGFERRIASGKGLKVLFAGASGTGKTMTAGVIARELGLDLYKIDLSGVVSKYIGETEKNLDRIFRAAECSNAILFFDEADALFGKRSEVKDAHDRYANIEVAYLLQKVEEHEGVVILASNLGKNIDEAFSRRMHYVVEFPLPDEPQRERLWRGMFPPEAPLSREVDWHFLAKQFPIAGGDIKNVALDAAFLAAQDGRLVTMKQLMKAMSRQMIKQGKIPSATDFKQYYTFIGQGD